MDGYQLSQDLARLICALIPLLVIVATVAVIWWGIVRVRNEKAQREQGIEPRYPSISSASMYSPFSSVDPSRPHAEPSISGPPAPPAKKRPTAKLVLIVAAGLVVVLAGAGALVAANTGGTTSAMSAAATTAAIPAAPASPSAAGTPSVSPTPALTTAAPYPTFATVAAWYHGGGKALIDAIRTDDTAIRNAGKNNDETAVRDACTKVLSDATAAKKFAPIPDGQAQPHWAKSLPLIVQGSLDCTDAIDEGGGDALLTEAVREMNQGTSELNLVMARLNALLG